MTPTAPLRTSVLVLLATAGVASAAPAVVPLTLPSGKVLQVEVMVKDEDRAMGLMFRPSLPMDHGLLFVFESPDFHGFWMKNCRFPIDMVWLDEEQAGRPRGRGGAAVQGGAVPRLRAAAQGVLRRRDERRAGAPREGGARGLAQLRAAALTAVDSDSTRRFLPNSHATSTPSR